MSITRRKVEGKISAKEKDIQALEEQLAATKAELRGMMEVLKLLPREENTVEAKKQLRPGSLTEKTFKVLAKSGRHMYVDEILAAMKKAQNKKNRSSLASVLSQYSRKQEIFSKSAPNTFGLLEWGNTPPSQAEEKSETDGDGEPRIMKRVQLV